MIFLARFNKTVRLIVAICLAVIIWIAGALIGQEQAMVILDPQGGLSGLISRSREIKISFMIDDGNGGVKVWQSVPLIYGQSLADVLKKLAAQGFLDFDYEGNNKIGIYAINGLAGVNGEAIGAIQGGGKQWTIWQNHQLRTEPLEKVLLKSNDYLELKFIRLKLE